MAFYRNMHMYVLQGLLWNISSTVIFSSAWLVTRATVMAQASIVHPLSFSETLTSIQAKFYGKLSISHISQPFLLFSKFSLFTFSSFFFPFSLTWELKFKMLLLPLFYVQFMINMLVMGECRLLHFCRFAKLNIFYGTWKLLLTQDHMGLEISTLLLLQFSSDLTQTLWGHWLPW